MLMPTIGLAVHMHMVSTGILIVVVRAHSFGPARRHGGVVVPVLVGERAVLHVPDAAVVVSTRYLAGLLAEALVLPVFEVQGVVVGKTVVVRTTTAAAVVRNGLLPAATTVAAAVGGKGGVLEVFLRGGRVAATVAVPVVAAALAILFAVAGGIEVGVELTHREISHEGGYIILTAVAVAAAVEMYVGSLRLDDR